MAGIAKNKLTLRELFDENGTLIGYLLFGFILGKKIRLKFKPEQAAEAQNTKAKLEGKAAVHLEATKTDEIARKTRLTTEQLRIAERAFGTLGNSWEALEECVAHAKPRIVDVKQASIATALAEWEADMKTRRRDERTINDNLYRAKGFIKAAFKARIGKIPEDIKAKDWMPPAALLLSEIEMPAVKKWLYAPDNKGAQAARTMRLKAFFNFCISQRYLNENPVLALKIKVSDLLRDNRSEKGAPKILTVDQCFRLLHVARAYKDGRMLPYVILATWGFLRNCEVCRLTRKDIEKDEEEGLLAEVSSNKKRTAAIRDALVASNVEGILLDAIKDMKPTEKIFYSRRDFDQIRVNAGIVSFGKDRGHEQRRTIEGDNWEESILRHTGMSYHKKKYKSVEGTTAQAGNSPATAYKHYLKRVKLKEAERFFGPIPDSIPLPVPEPVALSA
jgi:hypothetical protein